MTPGIPIDRGKIADVCRRWNITEFAFFGSVLRPDFGPRSDVDVLVTFAPEAEWGLFDLVRMQEDLRKMFRRDVDLLSRRGVDASRNHIRRKAILSSAQTVHVA